MKNNYNPDVLTCLANLSNDEVFTPPALANEMLDILPAELWSNPDARFLDPVCKSGVFLREIAKRLMAGLETQIPDKQARCNHIFKNQLFGFAITELTALLSRRSVYCSKTANNNYSVCNAFDDEQGNILYERFPHTWKNGKCVYCGASQEVYDRPEDFESYAYNFIHLDNPKDIFNMEFDVIIGNPPYQMNVGVEKENYAIPLYHLFVEQAKKLNSRYLTMIIPARWYAGGRGLDEFRESMLNDERIREIVDYPNATDCFPGVDIAGGICYFLWNRDCKGECKVSTIKGKELVSTMYRPLLENECDTFIRFNEAISILRKIKDKKEKSFEYLVSPQTPFGIISSFKNYKNDHFEGAIKLYTMDGIKYISPDIITKNVQWIKGYKVYISAAYGERGVFPYLFLGKPFIGVPNSCCTQTYLLIGTFSSERECQNVISYIQTKFFRFCIMLKKNAQHAMRGVYQFVPMQNFSESWNDEKLYRKYGLTQEEIDFIESMIRPMELKTNKKEEEKS